MKLPSTRQWRQFLRVLNKKEKIFFFSFFFLAFFSFSFLASNFYFKATKIGPKEGGFYAEGIIGQPRFLNPLYATSDTDRDLLELIYSGLLKYNLAGQVVPDLAKEYQIFNEGKTFEFRLRENLFWSDGKPLTTDDIIFTIRAIQNPDLKSPFRASFFGVEMEKISDQVLRFNLKTPAIGFFESLTLKILPKHIWQDIPFANFPLTIYNLKPVGSGPYRLKEIEYNQKEEEIKSLILIKNPYFYGPKPKISKIIFYFFEKEEDLFSAFNSGKIKGFSILAGPNYPILKDSNIFKFLIPRYFALFFNLEKSIFSQLEVRKALNYGTNKDKILEETLAQEGEIVHSPVLPEIFQLKRPEKIYPFDPEKAKEILEKANFQLKEDGFREKTVIKTPAFQLKKNLQFGQQGEEIEKLQECLAKDKEVYPQGEITGYFGQLTKEAVMRFQEKYRQEILEPWGIKKGNGLVREKTREKLNNLCFKGIEEKIPLKLTLSTVNQPLLLSIAQALKKQWQELGVDLVIETFEVSQLEREIIKPRNYEILLFGEALASLYLDPFPFWHSSQKRDFGLNLANYGNKEADKLLEEARKILPFVSNQSEEKRKVLLEKFQDILIEESPAIFLFNPYYLYFLKKEIKGWEELSQPLMIATPAKRFSEIEKWYIKTKRVWK